MTALIRLAVLCCFVVLALSDGRGMNMRGGMMRRYGPFRYSSGYRMGKRNNTRSGSSDDSESRPQRPWIPKNGSAEEPRRRYPFSPYRRQGRGPSRPSPPMRGPGPRMPQRQPSKPKNGSVAEHRQGSRRPSSPMRRSGPQMAQRRPSSPRHGMSSAARRRVVFAFMRRRVRMQRRLTRMRAFIGMFARRLASRRRARRRRNEDDKEEDKEKRMEDFLRKVKAMIASEDEDKKNKTEKPRESGRGNGDGYGSKFGKGRHGRKGNKSMDKSEMDNDDSRPGKRHGNGTDKRPRPMQGGSKKPMAGIRARAKMARRRYREAFLRRALKVLLKWKEDDDKDEEEKKSLEDLISKIQDILDEEDSDDTEGSGEDDDAEESGEDDDAEESGDGTEGSGEGTQESDEGTEESDESSEQSDDEADEEDDKAA